MKGFIASAEFFILFCLKTSDSFASLMGTNFNSIRYIHKFLNGDGLIGVAELFIFYCHKTLNSLTGNMVQILFQCGIHIIY